MILLYEYAWILLLKNCDICSALGMIVLLSNWIYSNNYSLKTLQTFFHKFLQCLEISSAIHILQISSFFDSLIPTNKLFPVIFHKNYMNKFCMHKWKVDFKDLWFCFVLLNFCYQTLSWKKLLLDFHGKCKNPILLATRNTFVF